MGRQRLTRRIGNAISSGLWWATVAPYCWSTDLPRLGTPVPHSISLGGDLDHYPVTELLGRLLWFRSRLRLTRAVVIVLRGLTLGAALLLVAKAIELMTHQPMSAWLPLGVFLVVAWSVHLALHHTISPFDVARFVDKSEGLNAQLATAVEYTMRDRIDRPLARTQIRLATNRLRDVEPTRAIPLIIPWRDAQVLGVVVGLFLAGSAASSLGLNEPRQASAIDAALAKQSGQVAQAPSAYVTMDATSLQFQTASTPLSPAAAGANPLANQLNALQQQLTNQSVTPEQYQQELKQVQQQIQEQADQSLSTQQALNTLASALKDMSATQSVSDSLTQGNYQAASQQLSDLSKQLNQLSPDARQQLAQRLAQAAQQTQKTDPSISQSASSTASALQQGNQGQAAQGMQDLAQAVSQASNQVAQQSQLGQALSDVQQQLGDQSGSPGNPSQANPGSPGNPGNPANQPEGAGVGQASEQQGANPQDANGTPGQTGAQGDAGSSGNGGPMAPGGLGDASMSATSSQIQQDLAAGTGGGVGNAAGAPPLSGAQQSLDVGGVKLTIVGKASAPGSSATSAGDRSDPLTASGNSTISGAGSSQAAASNIAINVHAESNDVPLDRKPVVREYFSNGTTSGQ
jgi:hypothetical protein